MTTTDNTPDNAQPGRPTPGTLAWFEVGTTDAAAAEAFYGGLFGWTFEADGPLGSAGIDYRNIAAAGAPGPMGGLRVTDGEPHAVFYILVEDVASTCREVERLGGSVADQLVDVPEGAPQFAYLRDPAGNLFGVFGFPG